jgi:hypothetical protein
MALAAILCPAQDSQSASLPLPPNAKEIPAHEIKAPFPLDSPVPEVLTVAVRTPDQMAEKDRLAEADAESSIAERAGFADLEFNAGKWSYRQLVCAGFPNHLFLRFTRDNGAGDQSVFTASIPRNGEGHVRIIPILRRSYSLFSPAPINAITISAFNRIRAEEKPETPESWVETALCYAAIAGGNPVAVRAGDASGPAGLPTASAPILTVEPDGGGTIRLPDASGQPRPVVWTMTFNKHGRLLSATRPVAEGPGVKPIPAAAEQTGNPIAGNSNLAGQPIPAQSQPQATPIPTQPQPTGTPIPAAPEPTGKPIPSSANGR